MTETATRIELPLHPVPSDAWQREYDALLAGDDGWLSKKTDRARRLAEHWSYLCQYVDELRFAEPGYVIDIGPGCGETLELCRDYGHKTLGVDAATGENGMGDRYLRYCQLMAKRQKLDIRYCGLDSFLNWALEHDGGALNSSVFLINMRGSIEQCLHEYMVGTPHDKHQNCKELSWVISGALRDKLVFMLQVYYRLLRPGGVVLIHANGSATDENMKQYSHLIRQAALEVGLRLVQSKEPRLHKWEKA